MSTSTSEQLARWTIFLGKWEEALQEGKEVIVMLDANLDFLTWRDCEHLPSSHSSNRLSDLVDALFDRILPLGVSQMVTGATRMERGQPKAGLDHIYTNKPEKLSSIQSYFTGMSDHKLLKVIRYSKSFRQNPRYVRKRSFKNFDEELFKVRLAACNLAEVLECYDVNLATERLVGKLTVILDDLAPIKTIQTRSRYAPWLSEDTKQLQKERNEAHEKASMSNDPEEWRFFRSLRNQATAKGRADKKKWEENKLDPTQNTSADTWKTVKDWLGWGNSGPPTQLFYGGRMVTKPAGLASSMNGFFIDKVKSLRSKIPLVNCDPLKKMKEAMQNRQCNFNLSPVTIPEVMKIIKGLKNSSATGVDFIDTRTVKLGAELLAPAITHIINLSINTSTFPRIWKWHKVIPLLKATSCDPLIPKSYRPVALLPIFSKILEKVVFGQLVQYLEENGLIHPNLHGSRAGHSTSTALLQMYDTWLEQVEEGKMVGVLLCDESAAFDLCDHYLLVEKLKLMGVEEHTCAWIMSYLSGRKQSCFIDGIMSQALDLPPCGVPQGSIGGPLLWVIFTCDQPDVIHDHQVDGQDIHRGCLQGAQLQQEGCGEMVGYVDDGAYSYAHDDPAVLSQVLTNKYNLLEEWMHANKLVINPDKTHLMVMASKKNAKKRKEVNMTAGEFIVKPSRSEKLLGGQLHESLHWNHHLRDHDQSLMKQLTCRINGLKRVCGSAGFATKLMVANGIIMSKLMYLMVVWGGAQQYLLSALQVQQLTAARAVCGFACWGWSKKRLLDRTGWLSIRQLIFFHTALQTIKIKNAKVPKVIYKNLSSEFAYNTRNAANGMIRNVVMNQSSYRYRAMNCFNQVPLDVRTGSQASVKRKLKLWVNKNIPID